MVELFSDEVFHSETVVGILKSCEDLERIIQKVCKCNYHAVCTFATLLKTSRE